MLPIAIIFPRPSGKSASLGSLLQANSESGNSDESRKASNKGKERDNGGDGDHNDENDENNENEGNDADEDPEEPNTKVHGTTERAHISFNIVSNIQYDSDEANVFQSLTTEGSVIIQATPLNPQMPNEFAKCYLQFLKLRSSTKRTNDIMAYTTIVTV
ncbi:hypothetical protein BYT27DRAFT_7251692 [Phlegmacium glaucopus]|nr:hypothetical protein BYT27DRAFT_7251692 [Phlegmacium glaucopus]